MQPPTIIPGENGAPDCVGLQIGPHAVVLCTECGFVWQGSVTNDLFGPEQVARVHQAGHVPPTDPPSLADMIG